MTTGNLFKSVLLVAASNHDLMLAPEVDGISGNRFVVRNVEGDVSPERLFAIAAQPGASWDIVHFAGHASAAGVLLSNGRILDVDSIIQLCRMVNAKLVFLNACSTAAIGQMLVDADVPIAIAALDVDGTGVPDDIGRQTAQAFYKYLAVTDDAYEAYQRAKPVKRGYLVWLADGGYKRMVLQPVMEQLAKVNDAMLRNDKEHAQILAELRETAISAERVVELKGWMLRMVVAVVAIAATVFGLLAFVGRAL